MRLFVAAAILAMSGGGAAAVLRAQESTRVYVYAQRETPARWWRAITCDGAPMAEIRRGLYFAAELPPGRHALGVEGGVPLVAAGVAGQELFVRLNWNHQVGRDPIPVLGTVPAELAAKEMKLLSYIPAKKAFGAGVRKADPREADSPVLKSRPRP